MMPINKQETKKVKTTMANMMPRDNQLEEVTTAMIK
jgi:hypothetical protein